LESSRTVTGSCVRRSSNASQAWRILSTPATSVRRTLSPDSNGLRPVIAIRGNVDTGHWAEQYPETQMVILGRCCIYVLQDIQTLQLDPVSSGIDVVVCGHSHRPRIETICGVLYLIMLPI
jgi:predicted phosphodiesterase